MWIGQAQIITRPSASFDIADFSTTTSTALDIDGDGNTDFSLVNAGAGAISITGVVAENDLVETNGLGDPLLFQPGDVISYTGPSFVTSVAFMLSSLSSPQFFGVMFDAGGVGPPDLAYFSLAYNSNADQLDVSNITYNSVSGGNLTVVPEPGSLAGLAVGAAGLLSRRRGKLGWGKRADVRADRTAGGPWQ